MQYVPTIVPYRQGIGETDEPNAIRPVAAAKRVGTRSVPPLIYWRARLGKKEGEAAMEERRRQKQERRQLCRRLAHLPITVDTRAGHDRRHGLRRREDRAASAIDTRV